MANIPPALSTTPPESPLWALSDPQLLATLASPPPNVRTDDVLRVIESRVVAELGTGDRALLQEATAVAGLASMLVDRLSFEQQAAFAPIVERILKAVVGARAVSTPPQQTAAKGPTRVGDPVDAATGQLVYQRCDLHLDGAGIAFDFVRTYRSQARYPLGPLGVAWDHSLNLWAREVSPEVVVVSSGELREDRYTWTTPRSGAGDPTPYFAPPDGFHAILERPPAGYAAGVTFVLERPDGTLYEFEAAPKPGQHRVRRIADRFGNDLVCRYDDELDALTLVVVNDHADEITRFVSFVYDDQRRIVAVQDSSGRVVRYTYSDGDDLVAATLPPTPGYPYGRSTFYDYGDDGRGRHQLSSVIDEDGRRYVEAEYGGDDGLVQDGKVVRLRDDQGEWLFEYAELDMGPAPSVLDAARYTRTIQPRGHVVEHWFNRAGNALLRAERAIDAGGGVVASTWRYLYNADGLPIAQMTPEGRVVQQLFGRDAYLLARGVRVTDELTLDIAPTRDERRTFGNHLQTVRRAAVGLWPPALDAWLPLPSDIVRRTTYEPNFQQISASFDARAPDDLARATRYVHFTSGPSRGALEKVVYPDTTQADGGVVSGIEHTFEYEPRGRLAATVDGEGQRVEYQRFSGADRRAPEALALPVAAQPLPPAVSVEGQVRAVTITGSRARQPETKRYEVNARGAWLTETDDRGVATVREVNDADLVTRTSRVLRAGPTPVTYATRFSYTCEGKVRREDVDLADEEGHALAEGVETRWSRYDDSGRLVSESIGAPDPKTWLKTRYVYDAEGHRSRTISPTGNVVLERYDAEGRRVSVARGFGSPEASVSRVRYDRDGNPRAAQDGRGNTTVSRYDAFGRRERVVQVVDRDDPASDVRPLDEREGHTRIWSYDAMDNPILERVFEWVAPGTYRLLTRTTTVFDEQCRPIRTIRDLFDAAVPAALGDFVDGPPPGSTPIEAWLFYDRNGRVVERREGVTPAGATSCERFEYDAAGRESANETVLLELGPGAVVTRIETTHDASGNPVRADRFEYELDDGGQRVRTEVISTAAEFDLLNRRTALVDGLGNRREFHYDSRDLLVRERDALGREITFAYDVHRRLVERAEPIDASRSAVTRTDYDDDGRVVRSSRTDTAGASAPVTIDLAYDALNRKTASVLARGTALERATRLAYDPADNVVDELRPDGLRVARAFDQLNRLTRVDYDRTLVDPASPIAGSTFVATAYDGLGRVVRVENDATVVTSRRDSLGRSVAEDQISLGRTSTVGRAFDPGGAMLELTYPSGRVVRSVIDGARRIRALDETARGTPNVGPPATGVRRLVERGYVGARLRTERLASGLVSTFLRDRVDRVVSLAIPGLGVSLTRLFDAVGDVAHEWRSRAGGLRSVAYAYNLAGWLIEAREVGAPPPALDPFSSPASASGLEGQAAIDALLVEASGAPATSVEGYAWDAGGNQAEAVVAGAADDRGFDALDRLVGTPHDQCGDQRERRDLTLTYDEQLRVVGARRGSDVVFEAIYDGLGRRVVVRELGVERRCLYDDLSLIAEEEGGALTTEYVARGLDERVMLLSGGADHYLHHDFMGSAYAATDASGVTIASLDLSPWGRALQVDDPLGLRHRYMGREYDASLDLYHFRARHYDAYTARFLQRDPVGASVERSSYQAFASNPLRYGDPLGTSPLAHGGNTDDPTRYLDSSLEYYGKLSRLTGRRREELIIRRIESLPRRWRPPSEAQLQAGYRQMYRDITEGGDSIRYSGGFGTLVMLISMLIGDAPDETMDKTRAAQGLDGLALLGTARPMGYEHAGETKPTAPISAPLEGRPEVEVDFEPPPGRLDRGSFRATTRRAVVDATPKGPNGNPICPTCKVETPDFIVRGSKKMRGYVLDHWPMYEDLRKAFIENYAYTRRWPSRREFLDVYNDPKGLRLSCHSCNESHDFEVPNYVLRFFRGQ